MEELFNKNGLTFMNCTREYSDASVLIAGAPIDFTVSFRPGTRMGPRKIRQNSDVLEDYSHYARKDISQVFFADMGDLILPAGNTASSMNIIEKAAAGSVADGKTPFFLGGEHVITFPIVKALYSNNPDLKVIQLDAHADLREEYSGEKLTHATVMRRICDLIGPENVYQVGIRSGTQEEFRFGIENTNFYFNQLLGAVEEIIRGCKDYPVYLSMDIDVVDPAFTPGTGTPEPGGFSSREALEFIKEIKSLNLIGCDLVEVAPVYDNSDITSIFAAKLVREILVNFF